MSPSGQPNSASRRSKIVRQTSIVPIVQTEPGAVDLVAAKKRRRFDPHAFLATIAGGSSFSQGNEKSLPKGIPLMPCFIYRRAR